MDTGLTAGNLIAGRWVLDVGSIALGLAECNTTVTTPCFIDTAGFDMNIGIFTFSGSNHWEVQQLNTEFENVIINKGLSSNYTGTLVVNGFIEVYDDPLLQYVAEQYNSSVESGGSEIDIVIRGQNEDPEADMIDFFFNFDDVATTDDMQNKEQIPKQIEEVRQVSVSKSAYYGKTGPSKRRHRIVKV